MNAHSDQPTPRKTRIKRLYYQSWHRGCKETDILFGRFADQVLPTLNDAELDLYEALLKEEDSDIWKWFTGEWPLPPECDHAIWHRLKRVNEDAVS